MKKIRLFVAAKAFIVYKGKILILKESSSYKDGTQVNKYDAVGGRINPGEFFTDALLREIKEETGLDVAIGKPFYVGEWRPHVRDEEWQVIGVFVECLTNSSKVILSGDHDDFLWINPKDYEKYNLIASIIPAFETYLKNNHVN